MASSLRCKPVASRMRQAPTQTSMLAQAPLWSVPGFPFSAGPGVPAGLSEGLKGLGRRRHMRVSTSQPPQPACVRNHGVGDAKSSLLPLAAGQKLSPPGPCWTHRLARLREAPGLSHPRLPRLPAVQGTGCVVGWGQREVHVEAKGSLCPPLLSTIVFVFSLRSLTQP